MQKNIPKLLRYATF